MINDEFELNNLKMKSWKQFNVLLIQKSKLRMMEKTRRALYRQDNTLYKKKNLFATHRQKSFIL